MTTMFQQNDFAIGADLYQLMAAEMGFEGKCFLLNHNDHPAIRARKSVQYGVLAEYTNIEMVNEITTGYPGTVELAYAGVESAIEAHPDVKAIWATFDLEAMGAAQALKAAGLENDVIISGGDAEIDSLRMIDAGGPQIVTIKPDYESTFDELINVVNLIVSGEPVSKFYPIQYTVITKDNVAPFLAAAEAALGD